MNDLDLCLEVVSRSREPLRYIWRWISRKPLEIEVWFQRTTNRKWHMHCLCICHMGYRMVTWLIDDVTWPWKVKLVTPIRLERNISKTTWARDFKFDTRLVWAMPSRRTNKFPWKWAWPITWPPQFLAVRSAILATAWLLVKTLNRIEILFLEFRDNRHSSQDEITAVQCKFGLSIFYWLHRCIAMVTANNYAAVFLCLWHLQ